MALAQRKCFQISFRPRHSCSHTPPDKDKRPHRQATTTDHHCNPILHSNYSIQPPLCRNDNAVVLVSAAAACHQPANLRPLSLLLPPHGSQHDQAHLDVLELLGDVAADDQLGAAPQLEAQGGLRAVGLAVPQADAVGPGGRWRWCWSWWWRCSYGAIGWHECPHLAPPRPSRSPRPPPIAIHSSPLAVNADRSCICVCLT